MRTDTERVDALEALQLETYYEGDGVEVYIDTTEVSRWWRGKDLRDAIGKAIDAVQGGDGGD